MNFSNFGSVSCSLKTAVWISNFESWPSSLISSCAFAFLHIFFLLFSLFCSKYVRNISTKITICVNGMEHSGRCSQNEPGSRALFHLYMCVRKCECVPRSNQNDKRSSHRFFGCTQRSRIPTLFSFFSTLLSLLRTRPFFFLIGVGQIEWNHPLNGIFRRSNLQYNHFRLYVFDKILRRIAFSFWRIENSL